MYRENNKNLKTAGQMGKEKLGISVRNIRDQFLLEFGTIRGLIF